MKLFAVIVLGLGMISPEQNGVSGKKVDDMEREKRTVDSLDSHVCFQSIACEPIFSRQLLSPLSQRYVYDARETRSSLQAVESIFPRLVRWMREWSSFLLQQANKDFDKKIGSLAYQGFGFRLVKGKAKDQDYKRECAMLFGRVPAPSTVEQLEELKVILLKLNVSSTAVNLKLGHMNQVYSQGNRLLGYMAPDFMAKFRDTPASGSTAAVPAKYDLNEQGKNAALIFTARKENFVFSWAQGEEDVTSLCLIGRLGPLQDQGDGANFEALSHKLESSHAAFKRFATKFTTFFPVQPEANLSSKFHNFPIKIAGLPQLAVYGKQLISDGILNVWGQDDLRRMSTFVERALNIVQSVHFRQGAVMTRSVLDLLKNKFGNLKKSAKGFISITRPNRGKVGLSINNGRSLTVYRCNSFIVRENWIFRFRYLVKHPNGQTFTNIEPQQFVQCENGKNEPCVYRAPYDAAPMQCMRDLDQPPEEQSKLELCFKKIPHGFTHLFNQKCYQGSWEACGTISNSAAQLNLHCGDSKRSYTPNLQFTQCFPGCRLDSQVTSLPAIDFKATAPGEPRLIQLGSTVEFDSWQAYFESHGLSTNGVILVALSSGTLISSCLACIVMQHSSCKRVREALCKKSPLSCWTSQNRPAEHPSPAAAKRRAPLPPSAGQVLEFRARNEQDESDDAQGAAAPRALRFIKLQDGRLLNVPENIELLVSGSSTAAQEPERSENAERRGLLGWQIGRWPPERIIIIIIIIIIKYASHEGTHSCLFFLNYP